MSKLVEIKTKQTNESVESFIESISNEQKRKDSQVKTGVGCLYINKLEDVDTKVLEKMIVASAK